MATNRIKKIKLTDGSVYAIFDEGALRLSDPSSEGRVLLLANNPVVDNIILQGSLEIDEVDGIKNGEIVLRKLFELKKKGNEFELTKITDKLLHREKLISYEG